MTGQFPIVICISFKHGGLVSTYGVIRVLRALEKNLFITGILSFADDSVLFAKTTHLNVVVLRNVMEEYCEALDQAINFSKSSLKGCHGDMRKILHIS